MFPDDIARKIVADHHAAPKPLAGAWDKDADLVRRISAALEKQASDLEVMEAEVDKATKLIDETRAEAERWVAMYYRMKKQIVEYAEALDTETFGAGLALPADLHAVAERLRRMAGGDY